MDTPVWTTAFAMFTTMMQEVWRIFSMQIGGVRIWEIYVLILFLCISIGFVTSFFNRDGHSDQ